MAIYHLTVKTGSKKGGQSAAAKAGYISRTGKYAKDRDEVLHIESGNMPSWATAGLRSERSKAAARKYWQAADEHERANGVLFREVEFALPRELTLEQQIEVARQFAEELSTVKGGKLPYTLAIHAGKGENPHCHLVLSERINDGIERIPKQWFKRSNNKEPERGGARKADIGSQRKKWLIQTRGKWAELANKALARAGVDARIDHRSLEAQGIERAPQVHLGPQVAAMEIKGEETRRGTKFMEVMEELYGDLGESHSATHSRGDSQGNREVGSGHGNAVGRVEGTSRGGAIENREHAASGNADGEQLGDSPDKHEQSIQSAHDRHQGNDYDAGKRDNRSEEGNSETDMEALGGDGDGRTGWVERAIDRIMALAGAAFSDMGGEDMANRKGGWVDRTLQAVKRQLAALRADKYEVGIKDTQGRMLIREWDTDGVLKAVPWLKRENAKGADIYIRPHPEAAQRYVLVDDIDEATAEEMTDNGVKVAAVIETSPKNCQAWVRLPDGTTPTVVTTAARILAQQYDADPNSADWRHFGRLAGFTNRKPEYTTERGQPFVLVRKSTKRPEADEELAKRAQDDFRKAQDREVAARVEQAPVAPREGDLGEWLADMHYELTSKFGDAYDASRADWLAAVTLFERGEAYETVAAAIRDGSPEIDERKRGHVDDYIQRTAGRAEIWAELKAQGARYEDVRDMLSELAAQRAHERAAAAPQRTHERDDGLSL